MTYRILEGDNRQTLKTLESQSVELIFTSPPYWTIKEYSGKDNEIGSGESLSEYRESMKKVFSECWRILKDGCYMVVNIGDQFVPTTQERPFHVIPLGSMMLQDMLDTSDNANYIGTVKWKKVTTTNNSGGGSIMGSHLTPRNALFLMNSEDIHFVRKAGNPPTVSQEQKEKSSFTNEERKIMVRSVWDDIASEKKSVGHLAPFPIKLAERVIRLRSFWGETVLDPFAGTGTTLAAAHKLGRNSIGCELGWGNDDNWKKIITKRIHTNYRFRNVMSSL